MGLEHIFSAAVGLALLTMGMEVPAEWTMEAALKQWSPMTKAVQHVGVPGCQWQVGVFWDGAMLFGQTLHRGKGPGAYTHPRLAEEVALAQLGDNMTHVSICYGEKMRFADRLGTNNPTIRKQLEQGQLPIPHIETRDGDLIWHQTVFAHLLDRRMEEGMNPRPDDCLVVQVRFSVCNAGYSRRTGHLWIHFGDTSQTRYACRQLADLAPPINHTFKPPFGIMDDRVRYVLPPPTRGVLRWHDELPPPDGTAVPARRVIEWEVPLAQGEQADLRLVIPYGLVDQSVARRAAELDFDELYREVVRFWRSIIYGPGRITTPDPFFNDYLAAVAGQMAGQIAYRHKAGIWMYKTSPNWYEDYYPQCAAKPLPTFDLRGLSYLSRPVLKSFIETQSDDASGLLVSRQEHKSGLPSSEGFEKRFGFLGNFGPPAYAVPLGDPRQGWTANIAPMGHGLELWALASHYRITRDKKWLGRGPGSPLQAMLDACDWIAAQRRRTMREVDGRKASNWGLLPAASAHDWLSGSTIFNDAWCIYGMAETVRLLREINHPRYADLKKELADYRKCLRERYIEARDKARRVPLEDGTEIPYIPRMVTELDWSRIDWTYTTYGPLRAGGLGALDPGDELVSQSLAFLDAGRPSKQGREFLWTHYVPHEPGWVMYEVFLHRDDLPRFFELLFNNFAAAVHHDFRVGSETRDGVVSCTPSDGEFWRMVRNMLVMEQGGFDGSEQSLFLLQAIPRSWLEPGNRLEVASMGSHLGGKIDLLVQVADDGNSISVFAKLRGLAVKPREIRMRLRSGDGRKLAWAEINGRKTQVFESDTIRLPAVTEGQFRIVGGFEEQHADKDIPSMNRRSFYGAAR